MNAIVDQKLEEQKTQLKTVLNVFMSVEQGLLSYLQGWRGAVGSERMEGAQHHRDPFCGTPTLAPMNEWFVDWP